MIQGDNKGRGFVKTVDWSLIITYLILVFIGWLNVYSSSYDPDVSILSWASRSGKQLIWILTGLGIGSLILFVIPPRIYEGLAIPVYLLTLGALIAVIFLGTEVNGSKSWFQLGPVSFQPAEISKISTSLMLSAFMSRYSYRMKNTKDFLLTVLILVVPMLIILLENETGSMLVYVGFIFMLYREGLTGWLIFLIGMVILMFIMTLTMSPFASILTATIVMTLCNEIRAGKLKKWFLLYFPIAIALIVYSSIWNKAATPDPEGVISDTLLLKIKPIYVLGTLLVPLGIAYLVKGFREVRWFRVFSIGALIAGVMMTFSVQFIFDSVLKDHQRKRIEVLLGMTEDPAGVGYNVRQSMIAIGSGGLFGKGFLQGTQTTYGFVPEQSTDFIFCTVGEEWGFLGSTAVVLLYAFLIWRIMKAAEGSRENFTRIYGYCVASCIFMHLIINIGMTIGLMPVIGIPLPLLSYGGSSLWTFTTMLFIFIALVRNEGRYF